jgi:hypothetical protein
VSYLKDLASNYNNKNQMQSPGNSDNVYAQTGDFAQNAQLQNFIQQAQSAPYASGFNLLYGNQPIK